MSWMKESLRRLVFCVASQRGRGAEFDASWAHFGPDLRAVADSATTFEEAWRGWWLASDDEGRRRSAVDGALRSLSTYAGTGEAWAFTRMALDEARQAVRATSAIVRLAAALEEAGGSFPGEDFCWPSNRDVAASSSDPAAWRRIDEAIGRFSVRVRGKDVPHRENLKSLEGACRRYAGEVAACRAEVFRNPGALLDAFASGAEHEARAKLLEPDAALAIETLPRVGRGIALADVVRRRAQGSLLRETLDALRRTGSLDHLHSDLLPATAVTFDGLLALEPWASGKLRGGPPPHDVLAIARAAEELLRGLGLARWVDAVPATEADAPAPVPKVPWPDERTEDAFTGLALAAAGRGWHLNAYGSVAW